MIYGFKCEACGESQDIKIPTWDIHNKTKHSLGIDPIKLSKRLSEERECECGGKLKRQLTTLGDPMFVEVAKQRFL